MRYAYEPFEPDEEMQRVALKIVNLLIENGLTYKKASETLETARTLLEGTKPSVN